MLCLRAEPGWTGGPGRTLRLVFIRGPGPDFSDRERDLLTVLRPHLHQAYLDAERRRHPTPELTARHWDLLHLVAAGHTNARSPAAWAYPREPCAPTWKTSTGCCRSPAGPPPSPAPSPTGRPDDYATFRCSARTGSASCSSRNCSRISLGPNGQVCSILAQMRNATMPRPVQASMILMADQPEPWKI